MFCVVGNSNLFLRSRTKVYYTSRELLVHDNGMPWELFPYYCAANLLSTSAPHGMSAMRRSAHVLHMKFMDTSCEIGIRWVGQNTFAKSTLVPVWLGAIGQQAITWTNVDIEPWLLKKHITYEVPWRSAISHHRFVPLNVVQNGRWDLATYLSTRTSSVNWAEWCSLQHWFPFKLIRWWLPHWLPGGGTVDQ